MEYADALLALPTVIASGLHLTTLGLFAAGTLRHRRAAARPTSSAPRVSVLKPLAGKDDELAENLESFAAIDYASFELLFGVARVADPAYRVACEFVRRHPELDARVVVTDPDAAMNPKVAQLLGLERRATGDVFVISDSNVRVPPSYLASLVRALEEPGVGLATSIFVGTGERTLGAALENLQLGTVTTPGIVATSMVTARPFTVGKSMAMRREDLGKLGGFSAFGSVLAEDHVLGRAFLDAGLGVATSLDAVENRNVDCSLKRTVERHTRWAKIRRSLYPVSFHLEPLLCPLAAATLVAVAAPSRTTFAYALAAAALQLVTAAISMKVLRGAALAWKYAPLEIVRTYVALFCWARACVSKSLSWRGHAFELGPGTTLVPARPSIARRLRHALR